jgi:Zn-dependent protease
MRIAMDADIFQWIQTALVYALPVLFAVTLHEAAHGYVAMRLGDNTAWMLGRVTLNPLKHIDPVGTILLPLLFYLMTSGAFIFGYAKPVPVRFNQLRHPKKDMVWVALAGPASNGLQALFFGLVLCLLAGLGVTELFFIELCKAGISVNIALLVFNLLPVLPLDGGRVATGLLPARWSFQLSRLEPFGFFIVLALVYSGILGTVWMAPLMHFFRHVLALLLTPLTMWLS